MDEKIEENDILSSLSFWNQDVSEENNCQKENRNRDRHKMEKLDQALDKIKEKYGDDAVRRAGAFFLEK